MKDIGYSEVAIPSIDAVIASGVYGARQSAIGEIGVIRGKKKEIASSCLAKTYLIVSAK